MEYPSYSTAKNNSNKNQQEECGIIYLNTTNKFIIKSSTTQPSPLPWLFKKLQGEKTRMSGLDAFHGQFSITLKDKFKGWINSDTVNEIYTGQK